MKDGDLTRVSKAVLESTAVGNMSEYPAHLWVTSACKPVLIVSTSCAMFRASPYFSTRPSQPSLTIMSSRGFPKAARTGDAVILEGGKLQLWCRVSKSSGPSLSRQGAQCCSCFVDRNRGGPPGNALPLPWQHKQATKTVSGHKPRYHVSHDAIRGGKTSRCPPSELGVSHPPPLILTQPRSHSFVCSIPGRSVKTS